MRMRTLLIGFVSAILTMAGYLPVRAAGDANSARVSSDRDPGKEPNGSEETSGAAPESSDDECLATEPAYIHSMKQQNVCLGSRSCRACPCVYGEVEALLLEQIPRFQNRPMVVDPNTGTTFLSTSDLDSGIDPGLRATFGVRLCNGQAVEFSYFGVSRGGFTLTEKPDNTSYLIFPDNFAGNVFVNMDRVQTDYSSHVNSFELNFPCCRGCCTKCGCGEPTCSECGCVMPVYSEICYSSVEWFAGVRYLDIGSDLNITVGRRELGGMEEGSYNIQAGNHLIGGQLGVRLRRTVNRLGWELTGKAGVYANDAEQSQSVIDFPLFPLRPTTSAQGGNTAFVGEINFSGIYRLTDVWSAKVGYNVIWIEGLALASDQLDFNFATSPSGNQLHASGGLLLHGVNLGLEARW